MVTLFESRTDISAYWVKGNGLKVQRKPLICQSPVLGFDRKKLWVLSSRSEGSTRLWLLSNSDFVKISAQDIFYCKTVN